MSVETKVLNKKLVELSDIESVIELCVENEEDLVNVSKVLNKLLDTYNITIPQFTAACGFSRSNSNLKGWFDGSSEPRCRTQYIKIALGLGMSLQETNRLLVRVGEYSVLYPKTIEDAAYICLICSKKSFAEHKEMKQRMEEELDNCVINEIAYSLPKEYISQRNHIVSLLQQAISQKKSSEIQRARNQLDTLNKEYKKVLSKAKHKLRCDLIKHSTQLCPTEIMLDSLIDFGQYDIYAYVREYWKEYVARNWRLLEYIDDLVSRYSYEDIDGRQVNSIGKIAFPLVDEIISDKAKISIDNAVSDLRNLGKMPSRAELITIGFILDQDIDGINNLLDIAGMEPLCVKRGAEAALCFALAKQQKSGYTTAKNAHKVMKDFSKYYEGESLPRLLDMLSVEDE